MEELFDLVEDGEEQKDEVIEIPRRGKLPSVGVFRENEEAEALHRSGGKASAASAGKGDEESLFTQNAKASPKREQPGDVAQMILERVEEYAAQERSLAMMLGMDEPAWAGRNGEVTDGEEKMMLLREWEAALYKGVAQERWHETVNTGMSGAEQLYFGINVSRLRGSERGIRNVVVHLNEPERALGTGAMDARTLDRMFQRDARRYDGGLSPL